MQISNKRTLKIALAVALSAASSLSLAQPTLTVTPAATIPVNPIAATQTTAAQAAASLSAAANPTAALNAGSVNINTASAAEIASSLNGIGLAKAQAIVTYREQNGPFTNVNDLQLVKGVGSKTLEKNAALIRIE